MDRPEGAATAASTASTGPHTAVSHKRNASKQSMESKTACGTTVVSLFVRNCRLLDLDLLPDWPSVTPNSLRNHDARTRIRCAEWCLYHLFRMYDSATTLDRLQPFFPPLEPLQSINLRAALYRCLNELKKNGVLGRETVLRKSMLDDCQGDKFWELCLFFSAIVLRKVRVERETEHDEPVAERIGLAEGLGKSQRDSMLPLLIAHRAAVAKLLFKKDQKRQNYARLYGVLTDKETDLRARKIQAQDQSGKNRPRLSNVAQDVLNKKWVGSNEVRDALLDGHSAAGADGLLTKSFDQVWEANNSDQLSKREASETGVLEELEARTRHQKRRLVKWQTFHEKLLASKPKTTKNEAATRAQQLRFDKHQNLTLSDISDKPRAPASPSKHGRSESIAKYDEILTAMREELRKRSATDPVSPTKPVERMRRRPNERSSSSVDNTSCASAQPHNRSMSQTAVPLRPMFGKRVSSRSRSYQQPKVINQREPIPLRSEIFSPSKTDRRNSASSSLRGSILASPIEDPLLESGLDSMVSNSPSQSTSSTNSPRTSWKSQVSDNADGAVENPSRSLSAATRSVRPSLADRTRMSMAFKSSSAENSVSLRAESETIDEHTIHTATDHADPARLLTLQERTRQSLSLAPDPPVPKKRASHARSRTSQYPINQFETPAKQQPRRSTLTVAVDVAAGAGAEAEQESVRREVTPREKLFDHDAEYSSIFKARPKVARSPDLTPQVDSGFERAMREGPGGGAGTMVDMDGVGVGSPLMGR